MSEIENSIISILKASPGLSDGELAGVIKGRRGSHQYINQSCRALAEKGTLTRKKRADGIIGNWLIENGIEDGTGLSDKKMKQILERHLNLQGWTTKIAWGFTHGIDIEANRDSERWIIEVKGFEATNPMPINLFLSALGEVLQRMDDPLGKYSVALPDSEQFRRLWDRLPTLAKNRTSISSLFVNPSGAVNEVFL